MFYLVENKRTREVEVIELDNEPSFGFLMGTANEQAAWRIAQDINARENAKGINERSHNGH